MIILLFAFLLPCKAEAKADEVIRFPISGKWEMGFDRTYERAVVVPGIHNDPAVISEKHLWYRKEVTLPEGQWKAATLELKGARFRPEVYINGTSVGKQEGGMAPLFFPLDHPGIKAGHTVTLEIALASLKDVPETDASYIPVADQWRSNVSSCLWDDVVLHFHGQTRIDRVIPFIRTKDQQVSVKFDLLGPDHFIGEATIEVIDENGNVLITEANRIKGKKGLIEFGYENKLLSWSPDDPNLYRLRLSIFSSSGMLTDRSEMSFGIKNFEVRDKQFYLNDQPFTARGVTVVWHRWMRTGEGRELGYDTDWFYHNIIKRSKDLGGNYLRFHLGLPPKKFLDLCDEHGLLVQYEWSFFHGMPASEASLLLQFKNWLDLAMRHPSVGLIHPYNETHGGQLDTAWAALDKLLMDYPPLVLEDRDVIHIHKYWWSLFENLGLYYDTAEDFPKAIMVDEFGGNYLDGNGDPGGYPTVRAAYLRFLGRSSTAEERMEFQALTNEKVAEYWRRIGAAGISPFCALGSYEDGNHWFVGSLKEGNPKPVWASLAGAFSPRSVSLEIWDRNFFPAQKIQLPLYLINDQADPADFEVDLSIVKPGGEVVSSQKITREVAGFQKVIKELSLSMPSEEGVYILNARLLNPPSEVKHPVYSDWEIRVLSATAPTELALKNVGVPAYESELRRFLKDLNLSVTEPGHSQADIIITSLKSWDKITKEDGRLTQTLADAIENGKSIVMLDVGDRMLGPGYPRERGMIGNLQGQERLSEQRVNTYDLFSGVSLTFTELVESESHIHASNENSALWSGLPKEYTWLWNGYRGGLIVPASGMEITGLSSSAFLSQWQARGADIVKVMNQPYYSYEMEGFYAFSDLKNDKEIKKDLKDKVRFLMEDAPALAASLNPNAPIRSMNLHEAYQDAQDGMAEHFVALAACGKSLTRTPVAFLDFGPWKGKLIVSQLLTAGRLAKGYGEQGLYGVRYDEAARQFVLNMMALVAKGGNLK